MRVHVVDPPAYTPPYDHALSAALSRAGARVTLVTTRFAHGEVPQPEGYAVSRPFYRLAPRRPRLRRAARLAQHAPDMLRYARGHASAADLVHFQWLPVPQLDLLLLPRGRPLVLTAHDVLPRQARPGQRAAQRHVLQRMDAVIAHSEHGAWRLREEAGVDPVRVHVIPHGPLEDLAAQPAGARLPPELAGAGAGPVVLCFGLLRPYKGVDVLLSAWKTLRLPPEAQLWIVGAPRMDLSSLRAKAPSSVRWVTRFVPAAEAAAVFRRADLVVLPYREIEQSGVLFSALSFGAPVLATDVGGFPDVAAAGAAELVAPGDAGALATALGPLLADPDRRAQLSASARALVRPDGFYGWDSIARRTLRVYQEAAAVSDAARAVSPA